MYTAKDTGLATVNARISDLYDEVERTPAIEPDHATRLNQATGALIPLRKTVHEMTTWPFGTPSRWPERCSSPALRSSIRRSAS